jgi:hypothetical protein
MAENFDYFCGMQIADNNGRRVVLVHWKKLAENTIEIFSSLKNFCDSHPAYNYHTLSNYFSQKKVAYENDEIRIERKPVLQRSPKPDLPKRLFWEFDYDTFDWQRSYRTVIERVIERGMPNEWEAMIHFYGRDRVINALKKDIPYLTNMGVEAACTYFQLSNTELKCYLKKQSTKEHWI